MPSLSQARVRPLSLLSGGSRVTVESGDAGWRPQSLPRGKEGGGGGSTSARGRGRERGASRQLKTS